MDLLKALLKVLPFGFACLAPDEFFWSHQPLICGVSPFTCVLLGFRILVSPVGYEKCHAMKEEYLPHTYILTCWDSLVDLSSYQLSIAESVKCTKKDDDQRHRCEHLLDQDQKIPLTTKQIDILRFKRSCC